MTDRLFVKDIVDGIVTREQVGIEQLSYKGRYGALTHSSTSNSIALGDQYYTIDYDEDKFRIGDDVLITSLTDEDCYQWGEISNKDTSSSPAQIQIFVDDISTNTGTYDDWEIQVVARPKPGIEKDISTSSNNPTSAGPFTFTVTSGKFFPIGGTLLIKPNTDRSIALLAKVKAYTGTSLIVTKTVTNATVSTSYDSWSIALLDAPDTNIPFYQKNGLIVTANDSDPVNDIDISAGSVRDSTNTVDLILSSALTKRLDAVWAAGNNQGAMTQSGDLPGTITAPGTTVTGSGTLFTADFYPSTQTIAGVANCGSIIESIGTVTRVTTLVDDESLDTLGTLGSNGDTYRRGGAFWQASVGVNISVARKDSDGSIDIIASSINPSNTVDLPSGYTYYRIIAQATLTSGVVTIEDVLDQFATQAEMEAATSYTRAVSPGRQQYHPAHAKAVYRAVITPTLLSGNISSVDTGTDEITWSSDLKTQVNNQNIFTIIPAVGGTWPTGATTRGLLYGRFATGSSTVFTLHTSYSDASLLSSPVNLTAAGSGTRTAHTLVASNILSFGMLSDCPIGGSGTYEATFGIGFNFDGSFDASNALVDLQIAGLAVTAGPGVIANSNTMPYPSVFGASNIAYRGAVDDIPISINGTLRRTNTWAVQSTTPFTVQLKVWA